MFNVIVERLAFVQSWCLF